MGRPEDGAGVRSSQDSRVKGAVLTPRVLGSTWHVWIDPVAESHILFIVELKAMAVGGREGRSSECAE